jgi:hypothetical protein
MTPSSARALLKPLFASSDRHRPELLPSGQEAALVRLGAETPARQQPHRWPDLGQLNETDGLRVTLVDATVPSSTSMKEARP